MSCNTAEVKTVAPSVFILQTDADVTLSCFLYLFPLLSSQQKSKELEVFSEVATTSFIQTIQTLKVKNSTKKLEKQVYESKCTYLEFCTKPTRSLRNVLHQKGFNFLQRGTDSVKLLHHISGFYQMMISSKCCIGRYMIIMRMEILSQWHTFISSHNILLKLQKTMQHIFPISLTQLACLICLFTLNSLFLNIRQKQMFCILLKKKKYTFPESNGHGCPLFFF